MSEKMIVTFNELPVLPYAMDYLKYCKHCGTYGLDDKPCAKCDRKEKVSIDEIAEKTVQKSFGTHLGITAALFIVMYLLCKNYFQLLASAAFSVILIIVQVLIYKKYKDDLIHVEMRKHIAANIDKIRGDLKSQLDAVVKEVDKGEVVAAYDRLRYLAKLIDSEEVRTFKLICLTHFNLRSEMPLEMNSLLQKDCNSYLIDYIYEVSKIKKDLIDEDTIMYILTYKEQVLAKSKGKQIVASVLEASLRSKYLLAKFAKYMPGYIQYFSKERKLRLCKINSCIEDEVVRKALLQEVKETTSGDEVFVPYLSELEEA